MTIKVYYAVLIIGVLITATFLIMRVSRGGFWGLFSKSVASVCFIATALVAAHIRGGMFDFASLMIMGFIFGMLGDIWLDLKWIYPDDKKLFLYAGFISFLIGHIFFVSAILSHSPWTPVSLACAVIAAVIIAGCAVLMEKPMKLNYGKYKLIVFIYSTMLSMTLTTTAMTAYITGFKKSWVVMTVGALLFFLSDLVLSGMYFSNDKDKNTPLNVIVNHTFYYAAQFVLAAVILFIG